MITCGWWIIRMRAWVQASYDLVSLLLDRQPTPPSLAELRDCRLFLLEERRRLGLDALDPDEFARQFRLMTIQRGLKAIGTFSYQTAVCDRGAFYEHFIPTTLVIVLQAVDWLDRFPTLRRMISDRLNGKTQTEKSKDRNYLLIELMDSG
jgi:aminoglycoside/choline kinase family phosphotransferase